MSNIRKRRSMSEPSLLNNDVDLASIFPPPLTLRDLDDPKQYHEDGDDKVNSPPIHNMNGQVLLNESFGYRSPLRPSPHRSWRNSSVAHSYDDIFTDVRQIPSADSYRLLNYPSFTSCGQLSASLNSRTSISAHENALISHDIDESMSGTFLELSPDMLSSPAAINDRRSRSFESRREGSDSVHSRQRSGNSNERRPTSARSNCTSVTMLNEDVGREKLQMLENANIQLNSLVSSLHDQLKSKKSAQDKRCEIMKERMISLKEETEANEKALRNAEEALEKAEMLCGERTQCIASLKREINRLNTLVSDTEISKQSALKNYEEACRDAAELAQQLEQVQSASVDSRRNCLDEKATLKKELLQMRAENAQANHRMEQLRDRNEELENDLRNAMKDIQSNELLMAEKKDNFQSQFDELKDRFTALQDDIEIKEEELKNAKNNHRMMEKELQEALDKENVHRERVESYQLQIEEMTTRCRKLEEQLVRNQANDKAGTSTKLPLDSIENLTYDENCACDVKSPRKLKAVVAELKMKLAAKDAQIQRLEAHVSTYSSEAEKLEDIRGDLINFVERSKTGDRRVAQLEGIVLSLEDERSKLTRRVMECEDELNDKKSQHDSLESRLSERTVVLKNIQNELDDAQKKLANLTGDLNACTERSREIEMELECKKSDNKNHKKTIRCLEDELASKTTALENAAEWTARRESENKREVARLKEVHVAQHQSMEKELDKLQESCTRYKNQAKSMECRLCQMQQENSSLHAQLENTRMELESVMQENEAMKKENDVTLDKLTKNTSESAGQVEHLQSTLEKYKVEISHHMNELQSANEKFNHYMSVKDQEVAKLEAELSVARESLKSKHNHLESVQQHLMEKEMSLNEMSGKMTEIESCNSCMKTKISKLEQHLRDVTTKAVEERRYWDERVKSAFTELSAKNQQFSKLNHALKQVEKEFNSCRDELNSVEKHVKILEADSARKGAELERVGAEERKATSEVKGLAEKAANLENELRDARAEKESILARYNAQESQFQSNQSQAQNLSKEVSRLKSNLDEANEDIKNKDASLARLQTALRESRSGLFAKERSVEELEQALDDRQWELTQRAAQLGKLEATVKEHKSLSDKRNIELQAEVRKAHVELKERNAQLGNLDEQLSDLRKELSEHRHLLDEKEQQLRHLSEESTNKNERIHNLEKELRESRASYAECHRDLLQINQELRVAREKCQNSVQQYAQAQGSSDSLKREYDCLVQDLRELEISEKEKDGRLIELMARTVSLQTEKNRIEQTYAAELEKLRSDVLKMHQQHQDEVSRLRHEQARSAENMQLGASARSQDLRNALEREKQAVQECRALRTRVEALEKEAEARKQVLQAANNTIVLKEAEIARVVAQYSNLERGLAADNSFSAANDSALRHLAVSRPDEVAAVDENAIVPRFSSTAKNSKQNAQRDMDTLSDLFPNSSFLSFRPSDP